MASRGKKKTTFAKLAREAKLRERRVEKQARKEARKRDAEAPTTPFGDAAPAPIGDVLPGGPDAPPTGAAE
jgi:hypothetical protein